MAPSKKKNPRKTKPDAIAVLAADHKLILRLLHQFERARGIAMKQRLMQYICRKVKVHVALEHEIFHPAFLAATGDADTHREARNGHDCARKLVAQIESCDAEDGFFDARMQILAGIVRHYIQDEEGQNGMFERARGSGMALDELGSQLRARKKALMCVPKRSWRFIRTARPSMPMQVATHF
jgi:hypothetical protein